MATKIHLFNEREVVRLHFLHIDPHLTLAVQIILAAIQQNHKPPKQVSKIGKIKWILDY